MFNLVDPMCMTLQAWQQVPFPLRFFIIDTAAQILDPAG
jgi:hypothetical protein